MLKKEGVATEPRLYLISMSLRIENEPTKELAPSIDASNLSDSETAELWMIKSGLTRLRLH